MFKVGEYIVHGRNGVCKVEDITHIDIAGADKNQLYYTLVPMKSVDSKIFFPVDSNRVIMRSVVTKAEAEHIVQQMDKIEPMWIENERQREAAYKQAICSCDCMQLIGVIKTLHERNQERLEHGKKATYVDDRYLKEAKENLHDEFAIALGIDKEEVEEYIREHVK